MFRAVLLTHWRWGRWGVLLLAAGAFVTPIILLGLLGTRDLTLLPVWEVLAPTSIAGAIYSVIAIFSGLWIAASAWSVDTTQDSIYALTRPVPRWYFVLLRYGSGIVLSLVPVAAVLIGALVAAAVTTRPVEMRVFPVALAAKFTVALWLSFSICFGGVTGLRPRPGSHQLWIIGLIPILALLDVGTGAHVANALRDWLSGSWSPLGAFFGRWNLFDV